MKKRPTVLNYAPGFIFGEQPEQPEQRNALKRLSPVIELLTAIIGFATLVIGFAEKSSLLSKLLLVVVIGAVATLPIRYIAKLVGWSRKQRRKRKFIEIQDEQLCKLFEQFRVFASDQDLRGLPSIARAISQVSQLVYSYRNDWISCFHAQLSLPPRSLDELLHRSAEFSALVNNYIQNFAVPIHNALSASPSVAEHYVKQLEEFREEFRTFLQRMEEWGKNLSATAMEINPKLNARYLPASRYERIPTFIRSTEVLVNGK